MTRCRSKTKSGKQCKLACMGDQEFCYNHVDDCPICLAKLGHGDETSKIACGHSFHSACIYKWFDRSGTCPVCRHVVRPNTVEVEHDPDIDEMWTRIIPGMIRGLVQDGIVTRDDRLRIGVTITVSDASTGINIISTNIQ